MCSMALLILVSRYLRKKVFGIDSICSGGYHADQAVLRWYLHCFLQV
jgi:hypothetical protein